MLITPWSTADKVTKACFPARPVACTVTSSGLPGRIMAGASSFSGMRRSLRSIATYSIPIARAGVVCSSASPPRNTSAVT